MQQGLKEHYQAVALLSDNLQDLKKKMQAIKYENVILQNEIHAKDQKIEISGNTINHLRELFVDHTRNLSKYNIVITVEKKNLLLPKSAMIFCIEYQECNDVRGM